MILRDKRCKKTRHEAHHRDERVDRGAGRILEWIAHGIAYHGSFMGLGAFAAEIACFDIFFGIIPEPARIRHEECKHNADEDCAAEEPAQRFWPHNESH